MRIRKFLTLVLLMLVGVNPMFAMSGGGAGVVIEEDFDSPSYQGWAGPGWYYGIWFDDKVAYYNWLELHFYDARWAGPNWYYGIWFRSEVDFNRYRSYHRHHGYRHPGDRRHHQQQHHGHWGGHGGHGRRH